MATAFFDHLNIIFHYEDTPKAKLEEAPIF